MGEVNLDVGDRQMWESLPAQGVHRCLGKCGSRSKNNKNVYIFAVSCCQRGQQDSFPPPLFKFSFSQLHTSLWGRKKSPALLFAALKTPWHGAFFHGGLREGRDTWEQAPGTSVNRNNSPVLVLSRLKCLCAASTPNLFAFFATGEKMVPCLGWQGKSCQRLVQK